MAPVPRWFIPALVALAACESQISRIPAADGPLRIDVRFPTDSTAVPVEGATPIWGTVGTGRASLRVNGVTVPVEANGTFASFQPVAAGGELRFVARAGDDSLVHTITLRAASPAAARQPEGDVRPWIRWVTMRRLPSDTADSATHWRPIYSRWRPEGEVAMPLPQGMRLLADARTDRSLRLRLSEAHWVWIPADDADTLTAPRAELLDAGAPVMTTSPDSGETVISIALPERLPSTVELQADRLYWTIYGAQWTSRPPSQHGANRPVRRLVARDSAAGRVVVDLGLSAFPLGWRTEWRGNALHLRLRVPPKAAPSLRGLIVALDPGHPPDGTTGPSGLREDSATLAVATEAAAMLRAEGATVIMTRTDERPLSLEARAVIAETSSAHLFVSLHLNAPGPGRPPEAALGTKVYFTNPQSLHLARHMSTSVAAALQQRNFGSQLQEFAVLRPSWMTAVLVEGSVIVLPEREAFFRTRAGVQAYAHGVVDGIRRWHGSATSRQFTDRGGH